MFLNIWFPLFYPSDIFTVIKVRRSSIVAWMIVHSSKYRHHNTRKVQQDPLAWKCLYALGVDSAKRFWNLNNDAVIFNYSVPLFGWGRSVPVDAICIYIHLQKMYTACSYVSLIAQANVLSHTYSVSWLLHKQTQNYTRVCIPADPNFALYELD